MVAATFMVGRELESVTTYRLGWALEVQVPTVGSFVLLQALQQYLVLSRGGNIVHGIIEAVVPSLNHLETPRIKSCVKSVPIVKAMADRPLPSSFDENAEYQETGFQKVSRKLREEPLVPLAHVPGAYRRSGLHRAGHGRRRAYYGADREKRKELIKLEAQKRAEERNEKWLHELEVRDDEDKKLQAAMKRKRDRLEQKRVEEAEREAERGGEQAGPKVATASADTTATAAATADAPSKETSGGSGVLGALSDAGGWFGTKKGPAEQSKADAEVPKK
ncbi:hypothetical protein CHU98_g9382 [Xylaria longipes]|nr:hypothetical protein CHU98_g9382 [Xylaria longipes]